MAKKAKPAGRTQSNNALIVEQVEGEKPGVAVARTLNSPSTRHGITACEFQGLISRGVPQDDQPSFMDFATDLKCRADAAAGGDLTLASELLANQAITLDAIFTEMARRSGLNMAEYINASERYMWLALKAQAGCRATLAKLHQPREQTVRHVHVNEGGQAVVADQFHHHAGGKENGRSNEQPHASYGGAASEGPALPGPDPEGNGVPISGDPGKEAMQDARR